MDITLGLTFDRVGTEVMVFHKHNFLFSLMGEKTKTIRHELWYELQSPDMGTGTETSTRTRHL